MKTSKQMCNVSKEVHQGGNQEYQVARELNKELWSDGEATMNLRCIEKEVNEI